MDSMHGLTTSKNIFKTENMNLTQYETESAKMLELVVKRKKSDFVNLQIPKHFH